MECSICMNDISNKNICTTSCNHSFCLSCLLQHLDTNTNCPLCREFIYENESSSSSEEEIELEEGPTQNIMRAINMVELKTYDIYGRFIYNNNLKAVAVILFVTVNTSILYLSVICSLMIFNK